MGQYYRDYADFLAERFDGKVQKLAINAGFTCPNRDGSKGTGGCIYCNNHSFNPSYSPTPLDIRQQIEHGRAFFRRKYRDMRYLAYFQAYTNSYNDISRLMPLYLEAVEDDDIVGLIIGTRPDCMPDALLKGLQDINRKKRVIIEYGVETSHNSTLQLINRCHSWEDATDAIARTSVAGLDIGIHLIMGLPGEDIPMMLQTIDRISSLPINTVKLHQLQILRGTRMATGTYDIHTFTVDEYIDMCIAIIQRLPKHIAIERFVSSAPDNLLISPRWGLKNYQFTNLLHNRLASLPEITNGHQKDILL